MSKNNKSLFDDYKKFERILKINPDNNVLDTSTEDFFSTYNFNSSFNTRY